MHVLKLEKINDWSSIVLLLIGWWEQKQWRSGFSLLYSCHTRSTYLVIDATKISKKSLSEIFSEICIYMMNGGLWSRKWACTVCLDGCWNFCLNKKKMFVEIWNNYKKNIIISTNFVVNYMLICCIIINFLVLICNFSSLLLISL